MASSESPTPAAAARQPARRDFLAHLEAYLARRDGADKLLKISRYAARLAIAAGPPPPPAASARLKSFESTVGLNRKAFRLGKFVQSVNALRAHPHLPPALALLAYGGEGVYYFLEQFVWLAKAGLLPAHLLPRLQRLSAWAELEVREALGRLKRLRWGKVAAGDEVVLDGEGARRSRSRSRGGCACGGRAGDGEAEAGAGGEQGDDGEGSGGGEDDERHGWERLGCLGRWIQLVGWLVQHQHQPATPALPNRV